MNEGTRKLNQIQYSNERIQKKTERGKECIFSMEHKIQMKKRLSTKRLSIFICWAKIWFLTPTVENCNLLEKFNFGSIKPVIKLFIPNDLANCWFTLVDTQKKGKQENGEK